MKTFLVLLFTFAPSAFACDADEFCSFKGRMEDGICPPGFCRKNGQSVDFKKFKDKGMTGATPAGHRDIDPGMTADDPVRSVPEGEYLFAPKQSFFLKSHPELLDAAAPKVPMHCTNFKGSYQDLPADCKRILYTVQKGVNAVDSVNGRGTKESSSDYCHRVTDSEESFNRCVENGPAKLTRHDYMLKSKRSPAVEPSPSADAPAAAPAAAEDAK